MKKLAKNSIFKKLRLWHPVPSLHGKQIGKQWKQWETLFWGAPKSLQMVTAAMKLKDAFSLEESYDPPRQHIKKQRHYLANKGPFSQSYGFSSSHVWMWELDYKVEHWRINAFELWCWRRFLRVPWTARRSSQSILKEMSPEYSLEELMLKLQYFGHLMERTDSFERPWCWERLKAGGKVYDRRWDGWVASPTWWTLVWASSGNWWTGKPGVLQSTGLQSQIWLSDWTGLNMIWG